MDKRMTRFSVTGGAAVLVVLLVLAIVQFASPGSTNWFASILTFAATPFSKLTTNIGTDTKSIQELERHYALLEEAAMRHIVDYNEYKRLQQENYELRQLLNFAPAGSGTAITATVMSIQKIDATTILTINRGSRDGIAEGMPVVVGDGLLLGLVAHVTPLQAQVVSVADGAVSISARVQEKAGTVHGIVEGTPGLATHLELIPKNQALESGDSIITSGVDQKIPANLLIGLVDKVQDNPNEFFKSATINFLTQPEDHTFVSVITQK